MKAERNPLDVNTTLPSNSQDSKSQNNQTSITTSGIPHNTGKTQDNKKIFREWLSGLSQERQREIQGRVQAKTLNPDSLTHAAPSIHCNLNTTNNFNQTLPSISNALQPAIPPKEQSTQTDDEVSYPSKKPIEMQYKNKIFYLLPFVIGIIIVLGPRCYDHPNVFAGQKSFSILLKNTYSSIAQYTLTKLSHIKSFSILLKNTYSSIAQYTLTKLSHIKSFSILLKNTYSSIAQYTLTKLSHIKSFSLTFDRKEAIDFTKLVGTISVLGIIDKKYHDFDYTSKAWRTCIKLLFSPITFSMPVIEDLEKSIASKLFSKENSQDNAEARAAKKSSILTPLLITAPIIIAIGVFVDYSYPNSSLAKYILYPAKKMPSTIANFFIPIVSKTYSKGCPPITPLQL